MGRRRRLSSIDDYSRALRNGHGVGVGADYVPWLRANDVSSRGRSSKSPGIKVPRTHHFLSDVEHNFFLCAEFNPLVVDIREQFPLFPIDLVAALALDAGLKYPATPKTNEPAVLTTDFLLTVRDGAATTYRAVAVKTADDLADSGVVERLELERIWWESLGVCWQLVTNLQLDPTVAKNLAWLSDPLRGCKRLVLGETLQADLETLSSCVEVGTYEWGGLVAALAATLGNDEDKTSKLLRAAAWFRHVSFDLSISPQRDGIVRITAVRGNSGEVAENARAFS